MKRSFFQKSAFFVALIGSISAHASESSMKADTGSMKSETSTTTIGDKKFEENQEITDAKLKADAGSLSKFSVRASFSYYGPPATDLSSVKQPNPDGVVSVNDTAISGNLGFRYRLNSTTSLSLYAGLSYQHPFQTAQKFDVNSPTISYDKVFRLGGVQILSSPGLQLVTQKTYTSKGEILGLTYLFNAVYNLGARARGFAIGSDNSLGYYFFDRGYVASDSMVRRINLSLSPFVKYNFNDRFNVNTSLGMNIYNLRKNDNYLDLGTRTVSQKLGMGYAFSRDVYVAPYLMFYPSNVSLDTTTINMSTSLSVL